MKKNLLIILFCVGSIQSASAANWVDLSSDEFQTVSVDANRIKYENKAMNQRDSWVRIQYNRPDDIYKTGEYTIANQIIDCENIKFAVKSVFAYTSTGQLKARDQMNTDWLEIPPDSNFEYVANTICSYPYL